MSDMPPRRPLDRTAEVVRQADFALSPAPGDGLTLEGYAAVFNTPTRIASSEGYFDEVIAPGAFAKTLRERGDRVVLQFDHGQHPMIGSIPIGSIEVLSEDSRGLYIRARLHEAELFAPIRQAIESKSIKGMSFRFQVIADDWDDRPDIPVRTIREVKLFEVGPVVFPAYEATTVGVRSAADTVALLRDNPSHLEEVMRLLEGLAPDPSAADIGTDVEGRDTPDDAAEPHVTNRTDEHAAVLERINKHTRRSAS